MVDINGKTIKKGMCLEILYEDDTGVGVGKIIEKSGDLGFIKCVVKPLASAMGI